MMESFVENKNSILQNLSKGSKFISIQKQKEKETLCNENLQFFCLFIFWFGGFFAKKKEVRFTPLW